MPGSEVSWQLCYTGLGATVEIRGVEPQAVCGFELDPFRKLRIM